MRVSVSVAKSGWLKSGHRTPIPCSRSRSVKYPTFVLFGDEAKP